MAVYLDLLVVLNFLVDLLLILAVNRLSGCSGGKRALLAAALGGGYGGACILPGFRFLGNIVWRILSLCVIGGVAFGFRREAVRRTVLFVLMSMALGGMALGLEGGFGSLILGASAVCLLCFVGFRGRIGAKYVTVQVEGLCLNALVDTGNTLTDPVSGQQVIVLSAQYGQKILGLNQNELNDPASAISRHPGVRLISYHAVGNNGGLLAAKRFDDVKIGRWQGSCLLAASPNKLPWDALTGGLE